MPSSADPTDAQLTALNAKIREREDLAAILDQRHKHFAGAGRFNPHSDAARRGAYDPTRREQALANLIAFFENDVELETLRAERTRLLLDRLPADDALAGEIAAASEALDVAKAAYHAARAQLFHLTGARDTTVQRRGEYARALAHHQGAARASRLRITDAKAELEELARYMGLRPRLHAVATANAARVRA